jgi:hypothetical protein
VDRGRRAHVARICAYAVGVGNLLLLVLGEPTTVTLGLSALLAPFTLAMGLQLTAFLACGLVSFTLGGHRERAELLVCAIGRMQRPSAGEKYQECMLAEIHAAPPHQVRAIQTNLIITAPRIILASWACIPRSLRIVPLALRERVRKMVGSSSERPGS